MLTPRLLMAGICFSLMLNTGVFSPPTVEATSGLFAGGELIEAPADATVYVSLGEVGRVVLSSGARVRLAAVATQDGAHALRPMLAAEVISGDVIVKLQPRAGALVQAAGTTFAAARGVLFHAGVRDGKAVFDASEIVASKIGNWAIRFPDEAREPESWGGAVAPLPAAPVALTREKRPEPSRPLRLDLTARVRPIGSVESLEAFAINSRHADAGSLLWGDELIEAPAGASARALLEDLGQVTLAGGSRARLAATAVSMDPRRRVLGASLFNGGMVVKLHPGVSSVVQAGGAIFVAPRGSRFRVMLVEGRAVIDAADIAVLEIGDWRTAAPSNLAELAPQTGQSGQQAAPRKYVIRPVGLSSNLVVRARSTRQIEVRVTDEDDRPIPGVPVIFSLSSSGAPSLGSLGAGAAASLSAKVFTDALGIASVSYTAGAEATTGSVSATVEGTNATWVGQINLIKVVPGFWTPQNAVPVMATAAAAAAVGVIKTVTKDDKFPIKSSGTTIIQP